MVRKSRKYLKSWILSIPHTVLEGVGLNEKGMKMAQVGHGLAYPVSIHLDASFGFQSQYTRINNIKVQ